MVDWDRGASCKTSMVAVGLPGVDRMRVDVAVRWAKPGMPVEVVGGVLWCAHSPERADCLF